MYILHYAIHYETIPWRRKWQPTPVFLPGESHEESPLEKLGGLQSTGCKESDTTERLHFAFTFYCIAQFSSVTQSCLTLQLHGLQHARLPCSSPTPWAYSNSCPLSWWCRPTISSFVASSPALNKIARPKKYSLITSVIINQGIEFDWIIHKY